MTIKIGFWNVNGLGEEKINDPSFQNIINQYDIICLTETWNGERKGNKGGNIELENQFPGYSGFKQNRKNKHKKAKRNSGGFLVLYRSTLKKYLTVIDKRDENILWVQIDKEVVVAKVILGTIYVSPENSTIYNNDSMTEHTLTTLTKHIASFKRFYRG